MAVDVAKSPEHVAALVLSYGVSKSHQSRLSDYSRAQVIALDLLPNPLAGVITTGVEGDRYGVLTGDWMKSAIFKRRVELDINDIHSYSQGVTTEEQLDKGREAIDRHFPEDIPAVIIANEADSQAVELWCGQV